MNDQSSLSMPPSFCQYASGQCDQDLTEPEPGDGLFLYPSDPPMIAATIKAAIAILKQDASGSPWSSWEDLHIAGQIVFCSICKAMRRTNYLFADVTTLNFNVLFEIGFALGLEIPVAPIRDASFIKDKRAFDDLGLLDTMGYTDFQNSEQLSARIKQCLPLVALAATTAPINIEAPLYVLAGPLQTEGQVRLLASLKRSAVKFRMFDPTETPRMSLYEVRRQVGSSLGVITHLLSKERKGAEVHNARCAFAAGLAMASKKAVLMLQEGHVQQPIDYRDMAKSYTDPNQVPRLVEPTITQIINWLQRQETRQVVPPEGLLEKLDIGDVAAENERQPLKAYFLKTGQYQQAKQGYARLVIGRKGSGKTAIFYAYKDSFGNSRSRFVLDLKPEGHQFTKLRESVLEKLTPGLQEHTMTAFWNAILLAELAHKITEDEEPWASRDPERRKRYEAVALIDSKLGHAERGDFSERLFAFVNSISNACKKLGGVPSPSQLTELLYVKDIPQLNCAVANYLGDKDEVALVIDNLDKGWPTRGTTASDVLIIRTLLEATRKLQGQLEEQGVRFHCLVFLRNDIYEHLVRETADKGKDTAIILDWADTELFKELFRLRAIASGGLNGSFQETWRAVFDRYVDTSDSFQYIVERTFMRPRDFLSFLHRAIEVAINRGHDRVQGEDLKQAEADYSYDMLQLAGSELSDVYPGIPDILYVFLGCDVCLPPDQVKKLLLGAGLSSEQVDDAAMLLAWYGFLGVQGKKDERPRYSYEMRYDLRKLMVPIEGGAGWYVVHPAFRASLECSGTD